MCSNEKKNWGKVKISREGVKRRLSEFFGKIGGNAL